MSDIEITSKSILKNMDDGVMTLDINGKIIMFNPAASKILGISYDEVIHKTFAEVFMLDFEANDEFNQTILEAVSQKDKVHNAIVGFNRKDSKTIHLSVKATYLKSGTADKNIGVIVVFSDITTLIELEESQRKLNDELKGAYLKLEASNQAILVAKKRKKVISAIAVILTLIFVFPVSYFSYKKNYIKNSTTPSVNTDSRNLKPSNSNDPLKTVKTHIVKTGPISASISLSGKFEPLNTFNILSPFSGQILEKMFSYGQKVNKGTPLLKLDVSEIEVLLRDAKGSFIKAKQEFEKILNWRDGLEVSQAKRQLNKAKSTLENAQNKLNETKILYDKGIVQRNEYEEMISRVKESEMAVKESEESLEKTVHQGNADNLEVVRFAMVNARIKVEELEKKLKANIIYSPVEGIAVMPLSSSSDGKDKLSIEKGTMVQAGQTLLSIGNLEGFTVRTKVDEVDMVKVSPGLKADVSVDAFPNIILNGIISDISTQAGASMQGSSGSGGSNFDMMVSIPKLTPEQKLKIRIGMTSRVEVKVYENLAALLVPLRSVFLKSGKRTVMLKDKKTGNFTEIEIQTSLTSLKSVEILSGLKENDEILLRE